MYLFFLILLSGYIAWSDVRTHRIPDAAVIILAIYASAGALVVHHKGIGFICAGMIAAGILMSAVNACYADAFGGGDTKLMCAGGLLLGPAGILLAFAVGILLAGVCIIIMKAAGKVRRDTQIALGPCLCAGILTSFRYGEEMIRWYLG